MMRSLLAAGHEIEALVPQTKDSAQNALCGPLPVAPEASSAYFLADGATVRRCEYLLNESATCWGIHFEAYDKRQASEG
jgi:hypothetical protein